MAQSKLGKKYGWRPSLPDHRKPIFAARIAPEKLATFVDLRAGFPAPFNQQQLGSCTANAIAGALEFDLIKQKLPIFMPSRLFIYYNERMEEGTVSSDSGATLSDGIKAVATWGAPSEKLWPYNTSQFTVKPSAAVYSAALKNKAISYAGVSQDLNSMQSCLALGYPFVLGFSVYESFESDAVAASGVVPMPGANEEMLGGHAVVCCGYNATNSTVNGAPARTWICRNSWGPAWGAKGYFYMPFEYLLDSNLSDDFWQVQKVA
jgi:C1A family cysteine protease